MIRNAIILLIAVIGLNSCTLMGIERHGFVDSNHGHIYVMTKQYGLVECPPWIPPALPSMPEIPTIPKHLVGNKKAEESILIASLTEHRSQIKELRAMVRRSFEEYVESCME